MSWSYMHGSAILPTAIYDIEKEDYQTKHSKASSLELSDIGLCDEDGKSEKQK